MKKKKKLILILIIFLIGLAVFLFADSNSKDSKINDGFEINVPNNPTKEATQKMIEIPSIEKNVITKDEPYLYLVNPKSNKVFFKYQISYQNEVLYTSELLAPNRMFKVDFFQLLHKGNHTLKIKIDTFDIETKNPQNGATLESEIIVS